MAKLVYDEDDDFGAFVRRVADAGESIPTGMAQAWATIRLASRVAEVGDRLLDIANAVNALQKE